MSTLSLEQLSELFDSGQLDPSRLSTEQLQTVREWEQAGDLLRAIPCQQASVSAEVMTAIAPKDASPVTLVPTPRPAKTGRQQAHGRMAVCVALLSLMAVFTSINILTTQRAAIIASAQLQIPHKSFSRGLEGCQVVMVTVDSDSPSPEAMLAAVRRTLDEQGIGLKSVKLHEGAWGEGTPVLGAEIEADVVGAVLGDVSDSHAYLPDEETDDLLQRFVDSLQAPTRSEEYFGDVVVVLPQEVLDAMADEGLVTARVAAGNAASPAKGANQDSLTGNQRRLIFVVRRRSVETSPDHGNTTSFESPLS